MSEKIEDFDLGVDLTKEEKVYYYNLYKDIENKKKSIKDVKDKDLVILSLMSEKELEKLEKKVEKMLKQRKLI